LIQAFCSSDIPIDLECQINKKTTFPESNLPFLFQILKKVRLITMNGMELISLFGPGPGRVLLSETDRACGEFLYQSPRDGKKGMIQDGYFSG
jgi:hypothetical protein